MLTECEKCHDPLFEYMPRCDRCGTRNPWYSAELDAPLLGTEDSPLPEEGDPSLRGQRALLALAGLSLAFVAFAALGMAGAVSARARTGGWFVAIAICGPIGGTALYLYNRWDAWEKDAKRLRLVRAFTVLGFIVVVGLFVLQDYILRP
jgi:hypothetical protein